MGCKWYEWNCRRHEAEKSIPTNLRQSHVRAEELLKRARLAMAVDCATMHRRGECSQANVHCSHCRHHVEIGRGNEGGWCRRPEYKQACEKNFFANIGMGGMCWISFCQCEGDHSDCPVWKAWQPIMLRAKNLYMATNNRLRYCGEYIYAAAGPEPGKSTYVFQDDDTNDPLSARSIAREDRAATLRAERGDTFEAAYEAISGL